MACQIPSCAGQAEESSGLLVLSISIIDIRDISSRTTQRAEAHAWDGDGAGGQEGLGAVVVVVGLRFGGLVCMRGWVGCQEAEVGWKEAEGRESEGGARRCHSMRGSAVV